jgi:hypothetical protein
MIFVAEDQRAKQFANLRAGSARRSAQNVCRKVSAKVEDQQRLFAKISTGVCRL